MISKFSIGQEKEVCELVNSVFDEFIGKKYSKKGNETFKDFVNPKNLLERHVNGNKILLYLKDSKIIGMIELQDSHHICLFFVHNDYQGQGIGKKLLLEMKIIVQQKRTDSTATYVFKGQSSFHCKNKFTYNEVCGS